MILINDVDGKPSINTKNTFISLLEGFDLKSPIDYKQKLDEMEKLARGYAKNKGVSLSNGAIANSRGRWYEWLVSIQAYNQWCYSDNNIIMVPLPNIRQFDYSSLYVAETYYFIQDLRKKLKNDLDIELITSNPDFVILDARHLDIEKQPIIDVSEDTFILVDEMYKNFIGKCNFEDILGYTAAKTSFRPDRRLQIVHEGSLTKAMYVHLQTRNWESSPKGIKYFGIALELKDRDIATLKTVATHSITTVLSKPERAVDECYEVHSSDSYLKYWENVISMLDR